MAIINIEIIKSIFFVVLAFYLNISLIFFFCNFNLNIKKTRLTVDYLINLNIIPVNNRYFF